MSRPASAALRDDLAAHRRPRRWWTPGRVGVGTPRGELDDGRTAVFRGERPHGAVQGLPGAYASGVEDGEDDGSDRYLPTTWSRATPSRSSSSRPSRDTQPPSALRGRPDQKLEELGVGRPRLLVPIITTIIDRGYVWKKGSALVPTFTAFAVVGLMEQHFPKLVDYTFTARMRRPRRDRRRGQRWSPGSRGSSGVLDLVGEEGEVPPGRQAPARWVSSSWSRASSARSTPARSTRFPSAWIQGRPVVARVGKFGPYLEAGGRGTPDRLDPRGPGTRRAHDRCAVEILEAPDDNRARCPPESGLEVHLKAGRFGPYVQEGERRRDRQAQDGLVVLLDGPGHEGPRTCCRCSPCRREVGASRRR
ncbi:MAG: DNA topoisomerase [Microthrixaceae bacterium]